VPRSLQTFSPLLVGLLGFALLLPVALEASAAGSKRSGRSFRQLTFDTTPASKREPRFESWDVTVHLDSEEVIERRIVFRYVVGAEASSFPTELPLAVVDGARGDVCDELELGPSGDVSLLPGDLRQRPFDGQGFDHLGSPELCVVGLEAKAGVWEGELVVSRPPVSRLDHRFAMLLTVQPLAAPAENLSFRVEHGPLQAPNIEPLGWEIEIRRKAIKDRRIRAFFDLERVRALPIMPVQSISGRVPSVAITSGEDWNTLALEHHAFFEAAARMKGSVIPLAGRVLGQPSALESVREAMRLALDEVELDSFGGSGGGWQLPQRASDTADSSIGTAADRAALLLALLRSAEIRAEIVLANRSGHRVSPIEPLALLNQTLVVLPELEIEPGQGPIFLDPSRGSAWLGAIAEPLIGRDALLLADSGARWIRLPSNSPRQQWNLNVQELENTDLAWVIEGLLEGAPAARVRAWERSGRSTALPSSDLAWLGRATWPSSAITITETEGRRLTVRASGEATRGSLLDADGLPLPVLPAPATKVSSDAAWPYSRDAHVFRVDLLESWVFQGIRSGGTVQDGKRLTPCWEVDILASWSGPVFNRRSRLEFTKNRLASSAAIEVERYVGFVEQSLRGVAAP